MDSAHSPAWGEPLLEGPGTRAGVACGARRLSRHRLPGNSLDVRRAIPFLCRRACRRLPAAALPNRHAPFSFCDVPPAVACFRAVRPWMKWSLSARPRRMTPALLAGLISIHSSCVHSQQNRCPLLISINSLCWEINNAMNVTDEEDRSLRRCDGMCAAKPLRFEIGIIRAVRTAGG